MTTPPPAPTTGPAVGGKLASKVGGPRNLAILGAGLTVGLVALLGLRKNKAAAATGTTTTITGDTAFDSGPYDMWNQWQQEYEQLQEQINAQQGGQTSATGPGATPKPPKSTLPAPIPRPPFPTPAPTPKPTRPKPKPPWHAPKPTKKPPGKKSPYHTVTVKDGDTLSGIAAHNHVSMTLLKKLNPKYWTDKKYKNGNLIWAGDKVVV